MSNRYGKVVHMWDVREGECFAYEIDYRQNAHECIRFCTDPDFIADNSIYPRWRHAIINTPGRRDERVVIVAPPYMMRDEPSDKFPHKCPHCNAPAYIVFMSVECSRNCDAAN